MYGFANGLLDLGANTIGADVEREHRIRVMIRLHAGFSAAAAAAALAGAVALAAGASAAALYAAGALAFFERRAACELENGQVAPWDARQPPLAA